VSVLAGAKQFLFRWKTDGTKPIRLDRRRIFILPTRAGLLFALALVVMLIAAINYNLALGHALVFLLAGLGIVGMHHTFRNLYGLTITPGRSEAVFAGEVCHFPLTIFNDRPFERIALELATTSGKPIDGDVPAHGSNTIALPLVADKRGWLVLPRLRLSTRYPLGLFVAWSYLQPEMRCLVYPKPVETPLPACLPASNAGERSGEGGQEDFAGFRERQPADSPRHIAWKASARQENERLLLVKQFAGGAQVELSLDWALTDNHQDSEGRLSQLAGWILAAESAGMRYALQLPGTAIAPDNGHQHQQRCLEALATFEA
jgi:uncharacterized protein (DUF58 family)